LADHLPRSYDAGNGTPRRLQRENAAIEPMLDVERVLTTTLQPVPHARRVGRLTQQPRRIPSINWIPSRECIKIRRVLISERIGGQERSRSRLVETFPRIN